MVSRDSPGKPSPAAVLLKQDVLTGTSQLVTFNRKFSSCWSSALHIFTNALHRQSGADEGGEVTRRSAQRMSTRVET